MTMKRIITLALALVIALSALALCSCKEKVDAKKDLENVKSAGVLKVGMECNYAPYNWTQNDDKDGAVKIANAAGYANGYDVQIAKKLADKLGVSLEIYAYKWDALVPAVESGALDCIIAGMSPTAERKQTIDFTSNYWTSNLVVIINKDGDIATAQSLADLAGKKIGAQDATFHADAVKQIADVQATIMDDFSTLYTALTAKTLDGYIAEEPTAWALCSSNESITYIQLVNNGTGFTASDEDVAVAAGIRKGSSLATELNAAIDALSTEERNALMQQMVALAPAEE